VPLTVSRMDARDEEVAADAAEIASLSVPMLAAFELRRLSPAPYVSS
jgi:hypothetical protein